MTDTNPNAARFDFALALIKDAGALAQSYFKKRGDLTIKSKGVQDMVSEADLNTELLIKGHIEAAFPERCISRRRNGSVHIRAGSGHLGR